MLTDRLFEYDEEFDVNLPKKLTNIWMKIDIEKLLKPVNYDELKECFVNSKGFFNPEFKYDEAKIAATISDLQVLTQGLSDILVNIRLLEENEHQTRAKFVHLLIASRLDEALSMKRFLEMVLKGCPERAMEELGVLYGIPERKTIRFAEKVASKGWYEMYGGAEAHSTLEALRMRKSIQARIYNAETVRQSLLTAMLYLLREPIMCRYFNNHNGDFEVKVGDYDKVGTVFEDGRLIIGVPEDCVANGEELLALVGREVDGHFRTLATTEAFISIMLGKGSPLAPLALVLAKSSDNSIYEGYARSGCVYVKGLAGAPEPFLLLAVDYAKHNHNFAETAERIFGYCLKYGLEETAAREKTWDTVTKTFLGQSNTRKLVKYAFTKDQKELEGYLRLGNTTEDEYFYLKNLASLEYGELQCVCIGDWLDDDDFVDEIKDHNDVILHMATFF